MEIFGFLVDFILHIDVHLGQIISNYGVITYAILFGIIYMETGVVFTPFLPGDSLLFAAGAFAALGSLNIFVLLITLCFAAIIGDNTNYWIGFFFGKKIVAHPKIPIDEEHIRQAQIFFNKHGGKTIIIARFMPFFRTFTPFVTGISRMHYFRFVAYDILGGIIWVTTATVAGYFFGNIAFVRHNFSLVIFAVILISILPVLYKLVLPKAKQLFAKKRPSSEKT
jgi:membrane-associated protein